MVLLNLVLPLKPKTTLPLPAPPGSLLPSPTSGEENWVTKGEDLGLIWEQFTGNSSERRKLPVTTILKTGSTRKETLLLTSEIADKTRCSITPSSSEQALTQPVSPACNQGQPTSPLTRLTRQEGTPYPWKRQLSPSPMPWLGWYRLTSGSKPNTT